MQNAHIIETALLLLIAFLIGCAIGWFVRTRFYRTSTEASGTAGSGSVQTSAPAAPVVAAPVAPQPATAPRPAAKKPAAKKAVARKPAAAKKPAAKKATAAKATAAKTTAKKPAPAKAPVTADAGKPAGLSSPRAGGKDDLKQISGVGPKLEEKLNALGIYHFDQIAGWNRQTIDWVDDHLSFKGRIMRDKWVAQAKAMAKK